MKFLITNAHSSNSGDLAIQSTIIKQLREISPDAEITILCSAPDFSVKYIHHKNVRFMNYMWPVFEKTPSFRDFIKSCFFLSSSLISLFLYRFSGRKSPTGPLNEFFDVDVVIGIGGGYLSHDYGFIRPYCDYIIAKLLGKKLVLYAHSIGPFGGFINREISKFVLGKADLIIVRENRSKLNLKRIGIRNVHLTADAAFAFSEPVPNYKRDSSVVLCPRKSIYKYRYEEKNYIRFLGSISKKIIDSGGSVTFLPTTPEDLRFHKAIKSSMPGEVTYITEVLSPDETAEFLSKAGFLISSRIHPIILGSLSSTPFFALGWEYKLDEISGMLCSGNSVRADRADSSTEKLILNRLNDRKKACRDLTANVSALHEKACSNKDILRNSLLDWGYL